MPLVSFESEDSARKMLLAWHSLATEKPLTALIKHHEECEAATVTQPVFVPKRHATYWFIISKTKSSTKATIA